MSEKPQKSPQHTEQDDVGPMALAESGAFREEQKNDVAVKEKTSEKKNDAPAETGRSAEIEQKPFKQAVREAFGETIGDDLTDVTMEHIRNNAKMCAIVAKYSAMRFDGKTFGETYYEHDEALRNRLYEAIARFSNATEQKALTQSANSEADDEDPGIDASPLAKVGSRVSLAFSEGAMGNPFNIVGKLAERKSARRQKLAAKLRRTRGLEGVALDNELNRIEKRRIILTVGAVGAVGIVGYYLFTRHGVDHPGSSGAPNNHGENPTIPPHHPGATGPSPEQLNTYSDMFDTSKMADKLHHANDFSAGNPDLLNLNKTGAMHNLQGMLRGNSNITAMWASQLHIPGAPDMPSPDMLMNSQSASDAFTAQVADYGTFLQNNPKVHAEISMKILDAVNQGTIDNHVTTLDPGYFSTGSNNTLNQVIDGTRPSTPGLPNQVFLNPDTSYRDAQAVGLHANGQFWYWETGCNQLAYQPQPTNAVVASYNTPAPQGVAYTPDVSQPIPDVSQPVPDVPQSPDYGGQQPYAPNFPGYPGYPSPIPYEQYFHHYKGPGVGNQHDNWQGPGKYERTPAHVQPSVSLPVPRTTASGGNSVTTNFNSSSTRSGIFTPGKLPNIAGLTPSLSHMSGRLSSGRIK